MESFNIGRVLSRTFKLVLGTLSSVGLFILAVQVISAVIQYFMQTMMKGKIEAAQATGEPSAALAMFSSGWYWTSIAFTLLLGAMSFAGSLHGLLQAADQRLVSFADCIQAGVAKLLPMLALTILWYLGVGLGFMLLIVPGLILMTMWSVAMPVLVSENKGVLGSFGRSRSLTKGSRLLIFVTLLVFLVLLYVVFFLVAGAIIGGSIMGMGARIETNMAGPNNPWAILATMPVGWLFASILNALLVSLYLETSLVKEGGVTGHLAATFE